METSTLKKGQRVAYVRVSTVDQNVGRQLEGLIADKTFTDHASGKNTLRPALQDALTYVREGDTLVIFSMDRLARNVQDLLGIVSDLNKRGVFVEFTKEQLTFRGDDTPLAQLMLTVMAAIAQFERQMLLERQKEGIAIAKREKRYRGRAPAIRQGNGKLAELARLVAEGCKVTDMARRLGVSRQTVYSELERMKRREGQGKTEEQAA
jgi:DNA invertase Pin-like site-specific DNA recombinase